MIFLIGSIVLTSWLTLSFKPVERYGLNNLQVIVINHLFCVLTGSLVNGSFPDYAGNFYQPWFPWACLMGFLFISLFNLIAFTAQKLGVAIASVANKLSLVIPFFFSLYLYDEPFTIWKIVGVVIALLAVVLVCYQPANKNESSKPDRSSKKRLLWILPVVLFFGSGLLDTMIKYVEHTHLDETNKNEFLITAFSMAVFIGVIILSVQFIRGKQKFTYKSIIAGAAIGIPNYFSIWCLLQVLKQYADNSSAIIPINNMGIVLFSAVMAWLLFREKLNSANWIGILLALAAIALIAYG